MKLSIIIPVFNEENTIEQIIEKVEQVKIPNVSKEIIIVNDASTDATSKKLTRLAKKFDNLTILHHEKNQGKGAGVQTALTKVTGEYIIMQDADLEYNPKDIQKLLSHVKTGSEIVYGTRLKRMPHLTKEERSLQFLLHYVGNRFLSLVTSILYGQWLTDMETCYKLFPKKAVVFPLQSKGFAFEPEITAKFLKNGFVISEVAISTSPRSYKEGKKLHTVRDGVSALWTLIKYRFSQ